MSRTNLKTDDFCSINSSSAPFYYTFQPGQYNNTYVYGEVGINAAGGSAGSYIRPDVVDVSSFLSGRDNVLSRCNPPIPGLDKVESTPMIPQNNNDVSVLIAKETREKKSAVDLSALDYNRWAPDLPVYPQDLRFIIEDFAPQRGGLDTQNYSKSAWKPTIARGCAVNGDPKMCATILSPSRACGTYCAGVDGYNIKASPPVGKPQSDYPFHGVTSQQLYNVGASSCGEQFFYGANNELGSCPPKAPQMVLLDNDTNKMASAMFTGKEYANA